MKYVTLAEVKEMLQKEAKKRDLQYEQSLALEHAKEHAKLKAKDARKLVEELMTIDFIDEFYAVKIADILPTHPDDVRAIFAKERYVLSEEQIKSVLDIVAKYTG